MIEAHSEKGANLRVIDINHPVARKVILSDWAISIIINTIVIPAILWGLDASPPRGLYGSGGIIADGVRSTVMPMLFMTFMITTELRVRRRAKKIPQVVIEFSWINWVPKNLILRCMAFIALGIAVLAPIRIATFLGFGWYNLGKVQYALSNALYGVLIGVTFSLLIILPALAERVGPDGIDQDSPNGEDTLPGQS